VYLSAGKHEEAFCSQKFVPLRGFERLEKSTEWRGGE
jgi:hypothetical protein